MITDMKLAFFRSFRLSPEHDCVLLLKSGEEVPCILEDFIYPEDDERFDETYGNGQILLTRFLSPTEKLSGAIDLDDIVGMIERPIGTPV